MHDIKMQNLAAIAVIALLGWNGFAGHEAAAQKIVCWKDKSGKVIGCGDKVPPEYQDAATKELDKRGITRGTAETAEQQAKAKALEQETAKQKEEEKRRQTEQRRQDQALLNTFSSEKEIDLKRDRELQDLDGQLGQLKIAHKNTLDREKEVKARIETTTKSGKPPTDTQKEDLARVESEKAKAEQNLANRQKDREEIRKKYGEMRERYMVLKGGAPAPAATAAAPAAAPAAPAAPAKK